MKVAIVGSRRYENKKKIKDFVFKLKEQYGTDTIIVSGGCKTGADKYAKKYALEFDVKSEIRFDLWDIKHVQCYLNETLLNGLFKNNNNNSNNNSNSNNNKPISNKPITIVMTITINLPWVPLATV